MAKKLGIAFGSGASKGIAHIGVMKAFEENGIKADMVTGCSSGSIAAACYALGKTHDWIYARIKRLKKEDLLDISINFIKNKALMKSQKMQRMLEKYFGKVDITDLKIPFSCIACDLITGKLHEFTHGDLATAVRASCSIPLVFSPVEVDGKLLCDGGVLQRTPVKTLKKLGAEVTVAIDVNCDAYIDAPVKNLFDIAFKTIDIMDHSVNRSSPGTRADVVIEPDLKNVNQYKLDDKEFIFEQGYKAGVKAIEKIKFLCE